MSQAQDSLLLYMCCLPTGSTAARMTAAMHAASQLVQCLNSQPGWPCVGQVEFYLLHKCTHRSMQCPPKQNRMLDRPAKTSWRPSGGRDAAQGCRPCAQLWAIMYLRAPCMAARRGEDDV